MNAHQLDAGGVILNTIVVDSLDVFPNLIDASLGGDIGDLWDGLKFSKQTPPPFDRVAASKEIDTAVIAIYDRPMSLSKEYEAREKAAADYKVAGYTGTVPARLAGFATPAGLEPQEAAGLILSQAAKFRGALESLSDLRMRKHEVQRATTEDEARSVHAEVMDQIAAMALVLV